MALFLVVAPGAAAELYKWVDADGVVNYSNNPPAKTPGGKPATVVEDTISVYTPEKSVTDAIERNKDRRLLPPPPAAYPREADRRATAPPPPPPVAYDPCFNPGDPNCQAYLYDGSPAFAGQRRPPQLLQPQLPPGTFTGQPLNTPPQRSSAAARFPDRDRDRERERERDTAPRSR